MTAGRFFDLRRLVTGEPISVAATNNLLLDMRRLRDRPLRFDERFGLSGGSDTLFTRTLHARGEPMVWCDDAVVVDRVPAARLTADWVLRRARRSGNSAVRVDVVLATSVPRRVVARLRGLASGGLRVVTGAARMLVGRASRSLADDARGRRTLHRGLGMVEGAFGSTVVEYGRT